MKSLLKQADDILFQQTEKDYDHFKPKFHISPPQGLLNDPNGFIEFNGQYHLFFQWNPFVCDHGAKFWGHCVSSNLMHWEFKPTALAPDASYDAHGCYSGSAFIFNAEMYLFYTGNLKDNNNQRYSTQCLAKASDVSLEKYQKLGPVIPSQPEGYTAHFRDPKVWQHEGKWYCVIGAQTEQELGQVLLYSSMEPMNWQFEGPIAGNGINGVDNFGYMFECPDLFAIDDIDVLIGCPQGISPVGSKYQNRHNNGYFLGKFDYQNRTYKHGDFNPLDQGFEFYAPQTTFDSNGRRLLSAWIGMPDGEFQPTTEKGWRHMLSMVRELFIVDGKLRQIPAREHKNLRRNSEQYLINKLNHDEGFSIDTNNCFELKLTVGAINGRFSIKLAEIDDTYIELSFDPNTKQLKLDRSKSFNQTGSRECVLFNSEFLELQIFFDHSIIEIFVNQSEEVFTTCVFPQQAHSKVTLQTDESCIIERLIKFDY